MKKTAKFLWVALLVLAMPVRQIAQTVSNNRVEIEIAKISNPDLRYCTLSALANDDNLIYTVDEENNSVIVTSVDQWTDSQLQIYFDRMKAAVDNSFATYQMADKETQGQTFISWKESLPQDLFVLLFRQMLIENPPLREGNQTCATSDPFCTTDVVSFHIDANPGTVCEPGPDYGCMTAYTQRPPFWFHMKIAVSGTFTIRITNTNNNDLDFCAWGPFSDPISPCTSQLTSDKIIDCDSPYNSVQECTIPSSSQVGQYYLMVITKYSSGATDVSFSKVANSGPGETDCGILPGVASNTGPYCVGETIQLNVNAQDGATYSWTGPNNFSSNQQNPTRPNCTLNMGGTYTCTTTVGNQSVTATTDVVVYPMPTANFDFTSVCVGNSTQFTSTSTTNPAGQQIGSYSWNFGDGQSGSGQYVTHTYANPGTYQATLTVSTGGHCTSTITKTVTVYNAPTCNFTFNTVCQGTATQFTSTATSAPGNPITSYQWNFGDGQTGQGQNVSHTYANAGTYQVTHTVQAQGNCNNTVTQNVTVYAMPTPTVSANPNTVIYGGTTTLTANAGTQGMFTFHWEPADKVVSPNAQTTQTVPLYENVDFTCTVTNPQGDCTGSAQVTVVIDGSNMTANATADQTHLCEGESTTLHANPAGGTGNYTYAWTPANTLSNPSIQNPVATPPLGTTTYTCHVSDGISAQDVSVTLHVHPNTESHLNISICPDETYNFFGELLSNEGTYDHVVQTSFGCDSTIHLHLTHHPIYETPVSDRFCQGDTYDFFGQTLNSSGIYYHTLETAHGCDSVIKLNLIQDPIYEIYLNESTCEGGPGYYFDGDWLQPSPYPYLYGYETAMGCDSVIMLQIDEAEYNSRTYNVSICATEYTWASNGVTYYETGIYYDTLHIAGACDSTLMLNLELRPSYNIEERVTSCDTYRWKDDSYNVDMTFHESTVHTHQYTNEYGCTSEVTLYLTINDHDETDVYVSEEESCDSYFWDPKGHVIYATDHEGNDYTMTGDYERTYHNIADCDSIVRLHIQMEYTPDPTVIYPMDLENTTPHWVITATEFQINNYDFNLWDNNPNCNWDTVLWSCPAAPEWLLEPFGQKGKCCKLYVLNYVADTIWLYAHAYNRCAQQDGIERKYWLVSSFYGVDDHAADPAGFTVVPNPNNGQMTLNFEYLSGKINVKVYDMTGNLIDDFETYNNNGPSSMQYDMKQRAEGIYFFVATSKEGTIAKKVVVRK